MIRPDIGSPFAKRFSATLLTHTEVNHHTGRGCYPTVRECYFLLFLLVYESEIFISLSSSRLRSEQLSTAFEESSRLRSFKFSTMIMLRSRSRSEKSSRLRSINYSRLCSSSRLHIRKVLDYDRQLFLTLLKSSRLRSITILNFVQVLDYDREIVLDQDREKSSTTIDNSPRSCSGKRSITIKNISITIVIPQLRFLISLKKFSLNRDKFKLPFFAFTLLVAPLFAYFLYLLLQEMAGKDPSTRTPTRPKLPAPRRPSPSNVPSGSTSEPMDAPLSSEYPRLTPSPGYHHISFNS